MAYHMTIVDVSLVELSEHADRAAQVMQQGGILIGPTDTLYGIMAVATDEQAYQRIFELKGRVPSQPLPLIAADFEQVVEFCDMPEAAVTLARHFWPGPLTLVLPAKKKAPQWCQAGDGTLAIRVPDHLFCCELSAAAGAPLTATSANLSGQPAARSLSQVPARLKAGADVLVDGGEAPHSRPSTILRISGGCVQMLREGAVAEEKLCNLLGESALERG